MARKKRDTAASDQAEASTVAAKTSGQGATDGDGAQGLAAALAGITQGERLVQTFLEQLPVGVALVDTSGEVRLSNKAFRRVVPGRIPSRDPEAVKRWKTWGPDGKLVQPANWPSARALRGENVTPGMEFLFTESDGRDTWQRVSSVPFCDASGAIVGAISIVQDIDSQKRAGEAMRASESTLRTFYESAPLMMGVVELPADNSDIIHIYDNPATDRFFGRPRGSTVGQSALAMGVPEEAVRRWIQQYRLAEREGRPVSFEYWHPRQSGAVWLSAVVARIGPGNSGRTRFSYVVADETERKRAEEMLRATQTRLTQAIGVAGLGTFEHDHLTDVIEYSPRMRKMMGFGEHEEIPLSAIGKNVVAEDLEVFAAAVRKAHDPAGDGLFEVEFRVKNRDGRVRWISKRSQTTFEGVGKARRPVRTVGSALDVTAQKEAEAELEKLVAERTGKLQELVGELEHFSYSITHDLKSPLRAMRGFAEIASIMCGDSAPREAKEALAKILTSAERMEGLITDALNYGRLVRQELPLTDVDTGALLRGMLDSYPELQPSRAHIQLEGKLPVVLGNAAGLTQCFSNLLGNAVKFVRPGQKPQIRVWAEDRDGRARIWVEDQGIGISKEMLPRVFHMFSRGSKDYEGTGIGLALVRKVTQRMGGKAGVESEEGKGSRFWIELRSGEARVKRERMELGPAEREGGTVLYVEDEETDAEFMRMAFARQRMESALRVVGDGRAAIEYLSGAGKYADRKEFPLPSVVLLDLNLPQLPGFEILKWMRNHPDFARTPVVVFSSSAREDDHDKALALGANEFIRKPNSGLKFGEVVQRLRERWLAAAR
jgi:PAS domain S-box-containing protein